MTKAEEIDYATKARQGDEDAENQLVLHTMREAFRYGKSISRGKFPDDEVFSLCFEALKKAAKKFRPRKGRFFHFAKHYVHGVVCRTWETRDVVKSSSQHETEETTKEASGIDGEQRGLIAPGYVHPNEDPPEPMESKFHEPAFSEMHTKERWALIEPIIEEVLSDNERMVISLRIKSGFNLQEIADMLSISRACAHSTFIRAIKKIRFKLIRMRRFDLVGDVKTGHFKE